MKKTIFYVWIAIMALPAGLQAQDTLQQHLPPNWTLQNAIAYARQNNIAVNTQRLSTKSAEQDLLQSKAAKLPNLTGSVSASVVNSSNADPVVGGFQTQANFNNNYNLNSSIILFNGGYIKNVAETENNITLNITQAYLNILLSKENIVYLQDVLTTSREQLRQAQQRFDAGSISQKDLLQFQSQVAADEYNLVNAQNTLKQNTLTLKQILLLPTAYNFEVTVPDSLLVTPAGQSLDDAQTAAQRSRPEVQNGQVAVQLAEVNLSKAKASVQPYLTLNGALSTGYSDNQTNPYLKQLNTNFYQSLGLSLNIPIYSRRVNKTNILKSQILIDQAKLTLLDTRNTLNQQVEQVYYSWQNATAQYAAATTQLKTSEQAYNITQEQLKLGAVNMVELLQQKNLYVQATQAYVQARYNSILYNKIFDFYTGVPITLNY
jgi:outer membrane protein